jgi:hypothetical protein
LHDGITRRWKQKQSQQRSRSANCQRLIHHIGPDLAHETRIFGRVTSRPKSWWWWSSCAPIHYQWAEGPDQ